ncbi:MAG TPA: hypothetical protein VFT15_14675 [Chitinophagaceae bacterium]|nr:hypothetical protein [Chitinophagaceae bacterium]
MDIDKIIEGLNKRRDIAAIGSVDFQNTDLTEVEKTFIKTYTPERSFSTSPLLESWSIH